MLYMILDNSNGYLLTMLSHALPLVYLFVYCSCLFTSPKCLTVYLSIVISISLTILRAYVYDPSKSLVKLLLSQQLLSYFLLCMCTMETAIKMHFLRSFLNYIFARGHLMCVSKHAAGSLFMHFSLKDDNETFAISIELKRDFIIPTRTLFQCYAFTSLFSSQGGKPSFSVALTFACVVASHLPICL